MCIVGKCWDYHVTEALRTDARRGRGHGGRLGRVPARRRACGCSSTPSTSSTATSATPSSRLRVLEAAADERAPTALVLCDTNGGSLPHEVERIVGEVVAYFGDDVAGRRPPPRRHRLRAWPTRSPACAAAPPRCRARSTATASAPATATSRTIIPNLTLKMGVRTIPPRTASSASPPVAHHVAELVNLTPEPAAALRRRRRRSPTRRACTRQRHRPAAATPTSTSTPTSVGNGTRFVVSRAGGPVDARAQGQGARPRARRPGAGRRRRPAQAARARGLPLRGGRRLARAAHAAAPPAGSQPFFELESFRVIVDHRARRRSSVHGRDRHRGHGQGARSTASGSSPPPRATARSTPSTRRCAGRDRPALPGARPRPPHRLQGAGARHRSKGTGAVTRVLHRLHRRRPDVVHHRRLENIIEASWQALADSLVYGLLHTGPVGSAPMAAPSTSPSRRSTTARRLRRRRPGGRARGRPDRPGELLDRPAAGRPPRQPRARPGLRPDAWPSASRTSWRSTPASTRTTPSPAAWRWPSSGRRCSAGPRWSTT